MDDAIVYGILDQLGHLNYGKKLTFHFYNEPLLDRRIYEFADYAAKMVPSAFRLLTTNGDLLDSERLRYLLDGRVSKVAVSAHDKETFVRFTKMKNALDEKERSRLEIRQYFRVGEGKHAARITNRAGNIDLDAGGYSSDEVVEAGPHGCNRIELNIDYQGDVHPCCMDFSGEYVLGNVCQESLLDIWRSNIRHFKDHFTGNYTKAVCFKCAKVCA